MRLIIKGSLYNVTIYNSTLYNVTLGVNNGKVQSNQGYSQYL